MHDQLEGVIPLEIKMLLQRYIHVQEAFTLETINERIKIFEYGVVDSKNRPSPIKPQLLSSNSASMSQTAAQSWCLARILPLLIGDLVPENDDHWENFLRLLEIEEIIFAPRTTLEIAAYLAVIVKDYLQTFSECYTRNLIPKQHYMVHYATKIVRRGPLVRSWAMRFEAKHHYFKKLVDKINNFKNIDYSLAKRHQALQAYLLQSSPGTFFKPPMECPSGENTTVADGGLEELCNLDQRILPTSSLTMCNWAVVSGTKYSAGCVIITGLHYGMPSFGKVEKIVIVKESAIVIIKCKTLQVVKFEKHLNAYHVELLDEFSFTKVKDLVDFHPLGIQYGFGCNSNKHFVVLRYRVDCM